MKFKKNTKGLSTIVATLLIILLVLVAVGIIWGVVRNLIQSGVTQAEIDAKCLEVDVSATRVVCASSADGGNTGLCNATVNRAGGDDDIGGLKLVFSNEAGESNYIHTEEGNMAALVTKTVSNIDSGIINASKVGVIVYFLDDSGNEQLCNIKNQFSF